MRTATRLTVTTLLLAATALTAAPAFAAAAQEYPVPSKQEHTYSIPVGAITDLGDLTKVTTVATDFQHLLGQ
ncbi:hypothetical protein C7C46_32005 [Streptomyces tateyamensis]|uniref:Uncharacterized protein n=1 Tax=Streptomyces tateyamensis TaxID=565073 RepID=A0A2V4N788_9ACTN|nr:hypothetical protein [Streptomyces tateyamensis]PYC65899.1 hypothetical protein C7C46_32005 [Streptomyces tateyamensis]